MLSNLEIYELLENFGLILIVLKVMLSCTHVSFSLGMSFEFRKPRRVGMSSFYPSTVSG